MSVTVNLFVDSLERLTVQQVKEFLGLNGARDAAMREGLRLDFKRTNPKTDQLDHDVKTSVCRAAAAFSSTAGGLIFVGIREENHFAREIVGVLRQGELKTKLDSVIRSGVAPVPRFTIAVAVVDDMQGKERDVAVIRVDEGTWSPYCYIEPGGTQTVVIRSNDKSIPPTLLELDALYAKRARLLEGWKPGPAPEQPTFAMPSARIIFQPMQHINVLLHRGTEQALTEAYEKHCGNMAEKMVDVSRSGEYSELRTEQWGVQRNWRGYSDGTVVFATELLRTMTDLTSQQKVKGVGLVDLAADLVNTSKAAHAVIGELASVGTVKVTLELGLARGQALNQSIFPGDRGRLVLDDSSLDPRNWLVDNASAVEHVDLTELADPDRLVARLLIRVLRATRGANINWESFSKSVTSETR